MKTPNLPRFHHHPVTALVAAAVVADAARRVRALSSAGTLAATAVGGAILAGAGLRGAAATLAFFVSSTLLGRLPRPAGRPQRRGTERDAVQVIANGGVAAALALAARGPKRSRVLLSGFAGALATATADTWATEIGSRASTRPRSVATGKPVPVGTSGGVSWAGLLASAAGALSIGAVMSIGPSHGKMVGRAPLLAVALGGFCGALADSILGAIGQEVRFCPVCGEETELPRHGCGTPTVAVRGIPRFDNDAVNLVATLAGAATTMAFAGRFADCPDLRRPRTTRSAP